MHKTVLSMSLAAVAALALSGSAFAAGQEGQTVFKDPASGRFRNPTAAEQQELNDAMAAQRAAKASAPKAASATPTGIAMVQQKGGIRAIPDEESISYSVMTRNAQGELVLQCVTGASAAEATMSTPATTESKEHQHEVQ
jgi:glucose/arabinose dehydrogenase